MLPRPDSLNQYLTGALAWALLRHPRAWRWTLPALSLWLLPVAVLIAPPGYAPIQLQAAPAPTPAPAPGAPVYAPFDVPDVSPVPRPPPPPAAAAAPVPALLVSGARLDQSYTLLRANLLQRERDNGTMLLAYDFVARQPVPGDSLTGQVLAVWGLAQAHGHQPTPASAAALSRAFAAIAATNQPHAASAGQYPLPAAGTMGRTGNVAVLILALLEAELAPTGFDDASRTRHRQWLEAYLRFLLTLRRADGSFVCAYDANDGNGGGGPQAADDGPALLALTRVARSTQQAELLKQAVDSAVRMQHVYVDIALAMKKDSPATREFYPWAEMAFYELVTDRTLGSTRGAFAARALALSRWALGDYLLGSRPGNQADAYAGLTCSWLIARQAGDRAAQAAFGAVLDRGLDRLCTWQVGAPQTVAYLQQHPSTDPLALGGVLSKADDPVLHLDTAAWQMTALLYARRLVYVAPAAE